MLRSWGLYYRFSISERPSGLRYCDGCCSFSSKMHVTSVFRHPRSVGQHSSLVLQRRLQVSNIVTTDAAFFIQFGCIHVHPGSVVQHSSLVFRRGLQSPIYFRGFHVILSSSSCSTSSWVIFQVVFPFRIALVAWQNICDRDNSGQLVPGNTFPSPLQEIVR